MTTMSSINTIEVHNFSSVVLNPQSTKRPPDNVNAAVNVILAHIHTVLYSLCIFHFPVGKL